MSHTENWIYVDQTTEIFRKNEFYDLKWNLDNSVVKAASFAGPIGNFFIFKNSLIFFKL